MMFAAGCILVLSYCSCWLVHSTNIQAISMQQARTAPASTCCGASSSGNGQCGAYHAAVEQQLGKGTLAQLAAISGACVQGEKGLWVAYQELAGLVWHSKPLLSQLPDYLEQLQVRGLCAGLAAARVRGRLQRL
jgi:hypothetical protein